MQVFISMRWDPRCMAIRVTTGITRSHDDDGEDDNSGGGGTDDCAGGIREKNQFCRTAVHQPLFFGHADSYQMAQLGPFFRPL
jgi:hypothetical protein